MSGSDETIPQRPAGGNPLARTLLGVALGLVVGGGAGGAFAVKLQGERDRAADAAEVAEERAQRATETLQALAAGVRDELSDLVGDGVREARRRVLERALTALTELRDHASESSLPAWTAEIHREIADLESRLGRRAKALETAKHALELERAIVAKDPSATNRESLGTLISSVADLEGLEGNADGARELHVEALASARTVLAEHPCAPARAHFATCLVAVGEGCLAAGEVEEARTLLEEARTYAAGKDDLRGPFLEAALGLGSLYGETEADLAAGLALFDEAIPVARKHVGERPHSVKAARQLQLQLRRQGELCRLLEKHDRSLALCEEAVAMSRAAFAQDSANLEARLDFAASLDQLASIRQARKEPEQVYAAAREALPLKRALAKARPKDLEQKRALAFCLRDLAVVDLDQRRYERARPLLEECRSVLGALAGANAKDAEIHTELAGTHRRLAAVYFTANDPGKGEASLAAGERIYRRLIAQDPSHAAQSGLARTLSIRARVRDLAGDVSGALAVGDEEIKILDPLLVAKPDDVDVRRSLVRALEAQGTRHTSRRRFADAVRFFERSVEAAGPLADGDEPKAKERLAELEAKLSKTRRDAALISGEGKPTNIEEHLVLAYQQFIVNKDYAAACASFHAAFPDGEPRPADQLDHVYNAACSASLASATAEDAEAKVFRERALAWVGEYVVNRRARLARCKELLAGDPGEESAKLRQESAEIEQQLAHARTRDPDLAAVRMRAEFQELWR